MNGYGLSRLEILFYKILIMLQIESGLRYIRISGIKEILDQSVAELPRINRFFNFEKRSLDEYITSLKNAKMVSLSGKNNEFLSFNFSQIHGYPVIFIPIDIREVIEKKLNISLLE